MDSLEPDLADGDVVIGRVVVYRITLEDGELRDEVCTDDGQGQEIDMACVVGMLAMAQHAVLCNTLHTD
jgi:hypothetical protein